MFVRLRDYLLINTRSLGWRLKPQLHNQSPPAQTSRTREKLNRICYQAIASLAASFITAPVVAQVLPATEQNGVDTQNLDRVQQYMNEGNGNSQSQITNASQFRDVQPTDWAYEALDRIVQRYGCLVGYPDGTYRGQRALSRYEFAAGLNACLRQIEALIEAQGEKFVAKEDFEALQRLVEEFRSELATLSSRVDNLEGRVGFLEAHQFSTTTKLTGEAIFVVSDAFSGTTADSGNGAVFQNRVRLVFNSSFTGRDALNVRFDAGNAQRYRLPDGTSEGTQSFNLNPGNNDVFIGWLAYYFPVNDRIQGYVGAVNGVWFDYIPTANPFLDGGTGGKAALTEYASRNPIYNIGGGSGVGFNFKPSENLTLSAGYFGSTRAADPASGLFNGEYAALGQVYFTPNDNSGVALTYVRSYQNGGDIFSIGGDGGITGTAQGNDPFGDRITTDSFGVSGFYQFSPNLALSGFLGYTKADLLEGGDRADIWYYALGLAFPNLGGQGNLGGLLVGAEPYRGDNPGANDVPFHIEAFFKYRLTDGISITPGVIWLTAPGQNRDNNDAVIGTIRTTFSF